LVYQFSQWVCLTVAVAGSLESPRFLLSGKPATALIGQTMAEIEPSRNHMPCNHMITPLSKGLNDLQNPAAGHDCTIQTQLDAPHACKECSGTGKRSMQSR
jgi:hypothetical protein